jgi:hypothetical protein
MFHWDSWARIFDLLVWDPQSIFYSKDKLMCKYSCCYHHMFPRGIEEHNSKLKNLQSSHSDNYFHKHLRVDQQKCEEDSFRHK